MKKKVIAMMLTVIVTFCMTACGNNVAEENATNVTKNDVSSETTGDDTQVEDVTDGTETEYVEIRSTGPNGEVAVNADTLSLTAEEIETIKEGNYTAAICMHYSGNDWASSQLAGLEAMFDELGIELLTVTDANFSAEQQVSDIETVMALNPDIIVSIPVDTTATADAYQKASDAGIKLVFMDNVPTGMTAGKDYVSCVSADNYGNGCIAADLLGEALNGEGQVGMVYYDADYFVTNQRDQGFKDELAKKYPNIEIVTEQGFTDENSCSEQGDAILTQYADINGIYASWDIPLEGVLSSIRAAGKEGDIKLATIDLGNNMAKEIAEGNVVGLGAQLPYDQGVAEATLVAMSLLGEECPAYVAVPAERVDTENVLEAYKDVYHVEAPDWLVEAYDSKN